MTDFPSITKFNIATILHRKSTVLHYLAKRQEKRTSSQSVITPQSIRDRLYD